MIWSIKERSFSLQYKLKDLVELWKDESNTKVYAIKQVKLLVVIQILHLKYEIKTEFTNIVIKLSISIRITKEVKGLIILEGFRCLINIVVTPRKI